MRNAWLLCLIVTILFPTFASATLVAPPGLSPGDTFRWIFATSQTTNAYSADIATYDAFVNQVAANSSTAVLNVVGVQNISDITWTAVASAGTTSARNHVAYFEEPVFNTQNQILANGFTDMFDGSLISPVRYDEMGQVHTSYFVWTGSSPSGIRNYPLGWSGSTYGLSSSSFGSWLWYNRYSNGYPGSIYAISEELTVASPSTAPIADAGPDQTLLAPPEGVVVATLDGSGSTDADGDPLTYSWASDTGYVVESDSPTVQIELPIGIHIFQLVVADGVYTSEPDEVVIEVVDARTAAVVLLAEVRIKKLNMLGQIDAEMTKEQQVYDTLEELLASGAYTGEAYGEIVTAKEKIHSALQHQVQAQHALEMSIQKLEDALATLGAPVEPE